MKKLTNLFMLLMMLVPLSLVSCSDDNEPSSSSIVGTWVETTSYDEEDVLEVTFKSDKTGKLEMKSKSSSTTVSQDFEYTLSVNSNNEQVINIFPNDCALSGKWTVAVSQNNLELRGNGGTISFRRK